MIQIGLERCLRDPPSLLRGRRFGLLMNQASVDGRFQYACDLLAQRFPGQLQAIFSPQHGLWSEQQANMIESPHGWYDPLQVRVFSLYSETRQPTEEMLRDLECLVVDLQDVGTRVYTFIWTLSHCLEACAAAEIPVVILDRPNPLGGEIIEGPVLDDAYISFVGRAAMPMRHGLTIGELALLLRQHWSLSVEIEVVRMEGWRRNQLFPATGRTWVAPSPNMPRFETALLYPGQVLLEGTNLSEGRGTTQPFELIGAPFVDARILAEQLESQEHPGLVFRPLRFVPTFDKWQGVSCSGVAWHVIDPLAVRSFRATVAALLAIQQRWPDQFRWLPPPYEYEREKMPIDILYGSSRLREWTGRWDIGSADELSRIEADRWRECVKPFWLYE